MCLILERKGFSMKIETNLKEVASFSDALKKQIPFAMSKAINSTAEKIRDKTLFGAKDALTLRGTWWKPRTKFGFNVKPSTKRNLIAEIYTKADWLFQHEEGGIKTAKGMIAIPTVDVKRTKRDIISKGNRPRNIKGAFKVTTKNGNEFIAKRVKGKLVVLYWLEKQAKIKGVYKFHDIAYKTFNDSFKKEFDDAIDYALRTAK